MIDIAKSQTKVGHRVLLVFDLTQHSRDSDLLNKLNIYLECGYVNKNRDTYVLRVRKFQDIEDKIIPFFKKYSIRGIKSRDFKD